MKMGSAKNCEVKHSIRVEVPVFKTISPKI